MAEEIGHHEGRLYVDQEGDLHLNGASVFNENEQDVAGMFGPASTGSVAVAADVLAIPVTHRVVTKTTGADAEALTLADGSIGQRLTVVLTVDGGGAGTLTPATATGWATVVFADAGDHATFEYVDDTVGWILVGASGVAAPPAITV